MNINWKKAANGRAWLLEADQYSVIIDIYDRGEQAGKWWALVRIGEKVYEPPSNLNLTDADAKRQAESLLKHLSTPANP